MQTYPLSQLTEETLVLLVTLHEEGGTSSEWEKMQIALTPEERVHLNYIKSDVHRDHLPIMNEATIWGRAIYPLLRLAEHGHIQAWSDVPLKARYPTFELEGEADGALAPSIGGRIQPPYLVVHEAKRGINAPNPQFQLYGEMLAAAWLNWKTDTDPEQQIFGCYTIADDWTFVLGTVTNIESEKPTLHIKFSHRYNGIADAERIVQILKSIVSKYANINT